MVRISLRQQQKTAWLVDAKNDSGSIQLLGSPQEFDGTRILGCFPEDHKFGPGRGHALSLQ